ncbi:BapA/Bap/LapF family large adhesin [Kerstersia gyiorum]|uniref:BapA/Bap/LapF family large adhesin n=1 Tax=Kerstersia gyiorum TaxID=206506 RepID=UPI000FD9D752|nr:BapA/Bap/LapF family large adhesin [Kerstersia gyiorum]MCH4272232.1 VCBS domain-containing protein [Kerstersia gyiorum]MCI1228779.1 VCBS domain-containing protein [Kerstersia gyiorum]
MHETDRALILVDLGGIGQAIFNQYPRVSFTIDENQSGNASITVSAGSLVGLFSGAQAKIEVKDENGNWVSVNSIGNNGIIDLIGLGGSKAGITLEDLPAGEYRVMAGASGVGIGTLLTVNADVDLFDHTEIGGFDVTAVSGNVLENDAAGEGAKVTHINGEQVGANGTTTFEGQYGSLTIGANGEFTYTPYDTNGLGIGKVETFEYAIKAADGSVSTAEIHIRIDSDGQGLIWPEDPSQPAEVDLVANNDTGETVINSDYLVTQGGPSEQAPSQTIGGVFAGAVTKTSSVNFTVDPDSKADVKITASSPDELLVSDSLKVTVTGPNGYSKTYTGTGGLFSNLSVQEMLQGLEAGNYTVTATYQRKGTGTGGKLELAYETQSVTHLDEYVVKDIQAATGNVLADDHLGSTYTKFLVENGSGQFVAVANGTTVAGLYGVLTINTDGSYSYAPTSSLADIGKEDVFTYRLEHPNGTVADATLTIAVEHGTGPLEPDALDSADEFSAFADTDAFEDESDDHDSDVVALRGLDAEDGTDAEPAAEVAELNLDDLLFEPSEEGDVDLSALSEDGEDQEDAAAEAQESVIAAAETDEPVVDVPLVNPLDDDLNQPQVFLG